VSAVAGRLRPSARCLALLLLAPVAGCSLLPDGPEPAPAPEPPRSVILLVGDGMGSAHREAARLDQEGLDGVLAMDSLPVAGIQATSPAESGVVTDSAAAATAWSTGERTRNGSVGVDVEGEPLAVLGVEAGAAGRATGFVTTSEVTDATPAAFFASASSRDDQGAIAEQYLGPDGPDVILGGGAGRWRPAEGEDLLAGAEEVGYEVVTDGDDLDADDLDGERLLGLFAEETLYVAEDEGEELPSLADLTRTALEVLSRDPDGFFLLVEEEGVDAASHANDSAAVLESLRDLDEAVEVALEYAEEHPETLVVVTGDHESGGLAVEAADDEEEDAFEVAGGGGFFDLDWTTGAHTAAPTPVTATGPGSGALEGWYPNTHLHGVLREALLGDA
jgi:alkaline phosphatase